MTNTSIKPSYTGQELHHKNCFACGPENPNSLQVPSTFNEKDGNVLFTYILRQDHEGAPGHSHGGVLATILDEAQGVLCHHLGHFVMTDNFAIKYHKATPLHTPLIIKAWLTSARRRRLYTKATISLENGEILVESKIKWYMIPEKILARKFDFSKYYTESGPGMVQILEQNRIRAREIRQKYRQRVKRGRPEGDSK